MVEWVLLASTVALLLTVLGLGVILWGLRTRLARLEGQVPEPGTVRVTQPAPIEPETYLITTMAAEEPAATGKPQHIEGRLFADLVVRESVVRAGASVAGLRRALAPESRNRIRFTIRQGAKQARKRRRTDDRAARRFGQRSEVA